MKKIKTDTPGFHRIAVLIIVVLGVLIYANTLNNPFVFDDDPTIVKNQALHLTSLDLESLSGALSARRNFTRPLSTLSFALNYYFHGLSVTGYHVVNIVIHLINGVLVYGIALLIFGQLLGASARDASATPDPSSDAGRAPPVPTPLLALFAALIFTAHPLQTQAVAYIAQRYASMAALFYMGALLLFMKARLLMQTPGAGDAPDAGKRKSGKAGKRESGKAGKRKSGKAGKWESGEAGKRESGKAGKREGGEAGERVGGRGRKKERGGQGQRAGEQERKKESG
ncbi:MAG: hypothetical protein GY859_33235, partial [Desulfobacterales bacterium]|nr:hypothetical protein [Desulfobacterales bacterium]